MTFSCHAFLAVRSLRAPLPIYAKSLGLALFLRMSYFFFSCFTSSQLDYTKSNLSSALIFYNFMSSNKIMIQLVTAYIFLYPINFSKLYCAKFSSKFFKLENHFYFLSLCFMNWTRSKSLSWMCNFELYFL